MFYRSINVSGLLILFIGFDLFISRWIPIYKNNLTFIFTFVKFIFNAKKIPMLLNGIENIRH